VLDSVHNRVLSGSYFSSPSTFCLRHIETGEKFITRPNGLRLLGIGALETNIVYPAWRGHTLLFADHT
jgi:hypothetical protein